MRTAAAFAPVALPGRRIRRGFLRLPAAPVRMRPHQAPSRKW